MRFVYFGTPQFAHIILDELKEHGLIPSIIVTAPDKPKGRHLALTPSEVCIWGENEGVPVIKPVKIDEAFMMELQKESWDYFVVAAYGKILPESLLSIPTHGTINVHPSLLPKFRGASPIESVILSDEKETGVSIMLLDKELDHGPLLAQQTTPFSPWPPKGSLLTEHLAHTGGQLLAKTMKEHLAGNLNPVAQDHFKATFTHKIKKTDGEIDPLGNAETLYKKIRAFDEWPGTYFFATKKNGEKARIVVKDASYTDGILTILRVVPEGKKEMPYEDFLRGL